MDKQLNGWNDLYSKCKDEKLEYDDWLDKYKDILEESKDTPIIDLGCGFGNDTLYLHERGFKVISCDYSREALNRIESFIPSATTKLFSMLDGLPFEDNSCKVLIADLSLHYFYLSETENILKEINRVLVPGGWLLCRVNSANDINHGAGQGTQLEENFYDIDGNRKRFFNKVSIDAVFRSWHVGYAEEKEMTRYEKLKILWEIAAQKWTTGTGTFVHFRSMRDSQKDYSLLAKWLSDPAVLEYVYGRDNPYDYERVVAKWRPRILGETHVTPYIIQYEGADIGYTHYHESEDKTYGIDLFIGETGCWGKGIGTQALKLLIQLLKRDKGAKKIMIDPQVWNERAIRCYEKCGFKKVKLLQEHELHEGIKRDCWLMEKIYV